LAERNISYPWERVLPRCGGMRDGEDS